MAAPIEGNTPGMSQWGPLASWGDRVVAYLIDIAPVIILNIIFLDRGGLGVLVNLATTAYYFYIAYMLGERGSSPGKRITGLKVVKIADGQVLGGGMGIVRYLAHFIDAIICGLGFLLPLVDAQRQTIADKILSTVVLRDQPKEAFGADVYKL
jgi:uncharacterized RDD family membrane protein YckC